MSTTYYVVLEIQLQVKQSDCARTWPNLYTSKEEAEAAIDEHVNELANEYEGIFENTEDLFEITSFEVREVELP